MKFPGAVIPDGEKVAAHYGNPFQEENKLRFGKAFTDLGYLEVVEFTGADRLTLLHNLSTRNFRDIPEGHSTEMLVLDPHGHIEHAAGAITIGDSTYLITDDGRGQGIVDFFMSMRFAMRVDARLREDLTVVGVMRLADRVPASVRDLATVLWQDPWPNTVEGGAHYGIPDANHPAHRFTRTLVVVEKDKFDDAAQAFLAEGLTPAGAMAWEATRVVDRRPRPNTEIGERVLPHELDWLRTAVHLNKGCYRGQETVAKLVNLGKPPRRLVYLYLEGPEGELPKPGDVVELHGRAAGSITSVVRDGDEGPVALALIKRTVPLEAVLNVGDFAATQEAIVGVEGKSSASPAERPGQGLSARRLGGPPPTMGGTIS